MRIKHFAGYGTIDAKKVSKVDNGETTILTVLVTGDHEQGLYPAYMVPGSVDRFSDATIKKWLLERFDKRTKDKPNFRYNVIVSPLTYDACEYVFGYNNDGSPIY